MEAYIMKHTLTILSIMLMTYASYIHTNDDRALHQAIVESDQKEIASSNYVKMVQEQWEQEAKSYYLSRAQHDEKSIRAVTECIEQSISSNLGFPQDASEQVSVLDKLFKPHVQVLEFEKIGPLTKEQQRALENAQEIARLQKQWQEAAALNPISKPNLVDRNDFLSEQTKFGRFKSYIGQHPYKTGAVVVVAGGLVTAGVVAYKKGYLKNPFAKATKNIKDKKNIKRLK